MKKGFLIFATIFVFVFQSYGQESENKVTLINAKDASVIFKNSPNVQLIDVRTKEEFASGHIKDAINIPITDVDFSERIQNLNKKEPVYLYCRSGSRSSKAANEISNLSFTTIYDIDGGIKNWQIIGLPLVK